mmetsp:Transcript_19571/g.42610  ORF Transcript_19571/g.42610 Transcript_19571/m.42610 type:complete len:81 (+) Transcript_19571:1829-2071(+)
MLELYLSQSLRKSGQFQMLTDFLAGFLMSTGSSVRNATASNCEGDATNYSYVEYKKVSHTRRQSFVEVYLPGTSMDEGLI